MNLFPILAVNFIGTLGYSIVMPFLIFLAFNIFYTASQLHAANGLGWVIGLTIGGVPYTTVGTAAFGLAGTIFAFVFLISINLKFRCPINNSLIALSF